MKAQRVSLDLVIAIIILAIALASACDKPDPLRMGRAALAAENLPKAEEALKSALAADPNNAEARRLMADVHILKKEYAKAESILDDIWKKEGLDGKVSGQKASKKAMIKDQFSELYSGWAESFDPGKDGKELERVARRGLTFSPKSPRLNTLLVEYLTKRGTAEIDAGDKLKAAETLETALKLRATKKTRKELQVQIRNLRLEDFRDRATAQFESTLKATYIEGGLWNEEKKQLLVSIEHSVDKTLKPNDDADKLKAQAQALRGLAKRLLDVICEVSQIPRTTAFSKPPKFAIVEETFKRGTYKINATIELGDALVYAFAAKERARKRAAKTAKKTENATKKTENATKKTENATNQAPDSGAATPQESSEKSEKEKSSGDGGQAKTGGTATEKESQAKKPAASEEKKYPDK
jgi:tetratricopeptide (TPR) repeat protein